MVKCGCWVVTMLSDQLPRGKHPPEISSLAKCKVLYSTDLLGALEASITSPVLREYLKHIKMTLDGSNSDKPKSFCT